MTEDVQACFEELLNTIKLAQNRAISFIEDEKKGALQKLEQQSKQLYDHMLSISQIINKLNEYRCDHFYNFLLVSM